MEKYYRVIKTTFMWEKDAILKLDKDLGASGGYRPIQDIWNTVELGSEYISTKIIENNPEWFERVYEAREQDVFITKEEAKNRYK